MFFFNPHEITGKSQHRNTGFVKDQCILCGAHRRCSSPKLDPYGDGAAGIMIIGEAPGKTEDETGINFSGDSGVYLKETFAEFDVDMDRDCIRTNVIQCRLPNNKFDSSKVPFCYDRLEQQIKGFKPLLILCFGDKAVRRILETEHKINGLHGDMKTMVGDVFPSHKYGCWVAVNYHPAYLFRNPDMEDTFKRALDKALDYQSLSIPTSIIDSAKFREYEDDDAVEYLNRISCSKKPIAFDFETTSLSPFDKNTYPICVSLCSEGNENLGIFIPLEPYSEAVWSAFSGFLTSDVPKVAHNSKFETIWSKRFFGHRPNNWYWDTMLSAHIIDGRRWKKSLAYQTYLYFGEEYKQLVDRQDVEASGHEELVKYSCLDSIFALRIMKEQRYIIENGVI